MSRTCLHILTTSRSGKLIGAGSTVLVPVTLVNNQYTKAISLQSYYLSGYLSQGVYSISGTSKADHHRMHHADVGFMH